MSLHNQLRFCSDCARTSKTRLVYDTIRVMSRNQAIAEIADTHGKAETLPGGTENVNFPQALQRSEEEFLSLCTSVKDVTVLTELLIRWSIQKLKDGNKLVLSAPDHYHIQPPPEEPFIDSAYRKSPVKAPKPVASPTKSTILSSSIV